MDEENLAAEIARVFERRRIPEDPIAMPIAGNAVPPGHPGYGQGTPIEHNETDIIYRYIKGRSWRETDARDLDFTIFYFTMEAIAYYLPAILIHNLGKGHELEGIDFYLAEYKYSNRVRSRNELYDVLSPSERECVASHMECAAGNYSVDDVRFWKAERHSDDDLVK